MKQKGSIIKMYMNGEKIFSGDNATVKLFDTGANTQNFLIRLTLHIKRTHPLAVAILPYDADVSS